MTIMTIMTMMTMMTMMTIMTLMTMLSMMTMVSMIMMLAMKGWCKDRRAAPPWKAPGLLLTLLAPMETLRMTSF